MSLLVNYRPGSEEFEERDVLVLYPGEQAEARGTVEWSGDGPWMAGCVADGTPEPKVIAAVLDEDGGLAVSLAHPQFDPNVDDPEVRVTGLRIYADPSARPERPRD